VFPVLYCIVRLSYDDDDDDDDDDDNKPVWPLGLWAPSSEGVR
jgi:hypothetical protein